MAATVTAVALAIAVAPAAGAATPASGSTCAELIESSDDTLGGPAAEAAAAYRTACLLKKGGLDADGLRPVAEKAAAIDPTFPPPTDLLATTSPWLVSTSHRLADTALAVATVAGLAVGLLIVAAMAFRATLGRFRRVRNLLHLQPSVTVDPTASGGSEELKNLPSLLQSVLGNLGTDVGGQNIQFVNPSSDDVSEIAIPASAPPQLEYLTWVVALLRPLAPKDRVTVRLTVQPEGRQGLGMTASLVGGPKGRTINSTTLWESDVGLEGIGDDTPLLGVRERYQLLAAPLAAWVYFTLADLTQVDREILGTRNWHSYGLFSLGCRLYKTHRQRGQRLLRAAIDADPGNIGAHLNILLLEFDGRRTEAGKQQLELLRTEVESLPGNKFCPRKVRPDSPGFWYDPTWYRTMYSLTAVCSHMVSQVSNDPGHAPSPATTDRLHRQGQEAAMDLVGACWIALNDLLPGGYPEKPRRGWGKKQRLQYRQRQELALFLGQMLPSSVLLLVNLRLLDRSVPVVGPVSPGSRVRVGGPPETRRKEWQRRADVFCRLDPQDASGRTCPDIASLLSAIDPLEFLPARARYNVACVHSEVAQYQDPSRPGADERAAESRALALEELEKGLDHDSAQWAREDPALWDVRTNHATRPSFADLVAEILCTPIEWSILAELPFIGVAGASRLWIGAGVKDAGSLARLGKDDAARRELLDNPSGAPWLDDAELTAWIERAGLRAHLGPRLGDAGLVDAVENLLHVLGITTAADLSSEEPWALSRKLVELGAADLGARPILPPAAVEVWAR